MIQFPCLCGHRFSLPEDHAGGLIQCPQCKRLNDVPTHGELGQIAPDGTYKVDAAAPPPDSLESVADLTYIYQRGPRDAEGNEIDLRLTPQERAAAGEREPIPLTPVEQLREHAPRYDPETGELIAPLEVKGAEQEDVDPASIPMAKPALNYATVAVTGPQTFLTAFLALFAPLNIAVMIGVFVAHVLLWPLLLVVFAGIMMLVVAVPILGGMILAHYGNVIEDIGPHDRDELPRPLRDLGWYEDIWAPFCAVFGSLLICYGPTILVPRLLRHTPELWAGWVLAIAFAGVGTCFFPAVLLTLRTSGTGLNLRPDRLMGLIRACGKDYPKIVAIWVIAGSLYLLGWLGTSLAIASLIHFINVPHWLTSWGITISALVAGIFLMHFFCVALGLLYRKHYDRFPWILQRHVSTRNADDPVGLPPSRRKKQAAAINRDGGRTARTPVPRSH